MFIYKKKSYVNLLFIKPKAMLLLKYVTSIIICSFGVDIYHKNHN